MNKILSINLGGYPFTINDDAYEFLNRYLDSIRRHFMKNQSYQEILTDIETRLAEIFSEKLGSRSIVTMYDVEDAIAIMGKPEEFGADPIDGSTRTAYEQFKQEYRTGKRLFRDSDDKVLGGVCSGLSAYFGVQDPIWIRLGFAIAFFGFGVGLMVYILLWVIVNEAETSADRLAMRGEPINVENIAKVVEEEFSNIGSSNSQRFTASTGAKGVVSDGFSLLGQLFLGIVNLFKTIAKPIILIIGVFAFIILGILWIGFAIAAKAGYPFSSFAFGDNAFWGYIAYINVFFLIGLTLLGIGLLVSRIFFKVKLNHYWTAGIGGFWLLNGISLGLLGANMGTEFHREDRITQEIFNTVVPNDTLFIDLREDNRFSDIHTNFGDFKFDQTKMLNADVRMEIEPSTNGNFRLVKEIRSNGNSREEALKLANDVVYQPELSNNILFLPEYFTLENTKYRAQRVRMILYVPEGKFIKLKNGSGKIVHFDYDYDEYGNRGSREGHTWRMTDGELESPELLSKVNFTKKFDFDNFTKINVTGNAKVIIRQGSSYSIEIKGDEEDVKDFLFDKSNNNLRISSESDDNNDISTITVTLPKLEYLDASNVNLVEIFDFKQTELKIIADGDFKINADVEIDKISIDANNNAQIVLKGKGNTIDCILDRGAELNARQYEVKNATMSMRNGTDAEIYATDKVVSRRNQGSLRVEGGATLEKGNNE